MGIDLKDFGNLFKRLEFRRSIEWKWGTLKTECARKSQRTRWEGNFEVIGLVGKTEMVQKNETN